jgi:hypothetical protein
MRVSAPGSVPSVTGTTRLGSSPATFGDYMDGSIDDVRIYNRALSAQEVQQLYSMGK